MSSTIRDDDFAICRDLVRQRNRALYLCSLLMPTAIQPAVLAVYAFHCEVSSGLLSNREPLAGEIRLTWWAEVVAGDRASEANANPVARALLAALKDAQLPTDLLQAKIEAHRFDLYQDPLENRAMLEGWAGETWSTLFHILSQIAGNEPSRALADISGHAGVIVAISHIISAQAQLRALGKTLIPLDVLNAVGLDRDSWLESPNHQHHQAVAAMLDLASEHSEAFRRSADVKNDINFSTYLPVAAAETVLDTGRKNSERCFTQPIIIQQLSLQIALMKARFRQRFGKPV